MKIKLAHSPDADDAFMFYGLAKGKLDTEGIEYEHVLKDIQTLNDWAREGRMEVTAISAHAYAYVKDKYDVLTHGGIYLLPIIAVDSNHTWLQSKFDARVVGRYMKAAPRTIQTPQVKKVAYREVTEARAPSCVLWPG